MPCVTSVAEPMAHALDAMHTMTGAPWWMTLMAGGALVRASLLPLSIKGQKATELVVSSLSRASRDVDVEEDRETGSSGINDDGGRTSRIMERARHYIRESRTETTPSPAWMVISPATQISFLLYGLYSVRYMASQEWSGFEGGGPSWAVDLTLPAVDWIAMCAPLGIQGIIMPALLIGALHLSIQRLRPGAPTVGENLPESVKIRQWALSNLATVFDLLTIPVALGVLTMPQAPLYYWTTSLYSSLMFQTLSMRARRQHQRDQDGLSPEARSLLQQAAQLVSKGSSAKASPLLYQALTIHPHHRSIHMALGQVSAARGQWADSEFHYKKVLEQQNADSLEQQALFGRAMALLQMESRREDAIEMLKRAASFVDEERSLSKGDMERFTPIAVRSLLALAMLTRSPSYRDRAVLLDPLSVNALNDHLETKR